MLITHEKINQLATHWAVAAIPPGDREKALRLVDEQSVDKAVGRQICFSFAEEARRLDVALINRVLSAYEIAAVEGLDELSTSTESDSDVATLARVAAYVAFQLIRCLPLPEPENERMFTVLKASAIAYCGDRYARLARNGWVHKAISNKRLADFGLISMLDYYTERCVTC